jgi:CheY-like chemotaxis protein
MPDINGLQLCREIRKKDKKAKICFLTASETISDTSNEFAEVYTLIKKPIENSNLIRIVNDLLNK